MALKGKKKSQSRGSEGRRHPAAAPRAVYSSRAHEPWYRTATGASGCRTGGPAGHRRHRCDRAVATDTYPTQRKNDLDQYTGDVRGLLQRDHARATEENEVPNKLTA